MIKNGWFKKAALFFWFPSIFFGSPTLVFVSHVLMIDLTFTAAIIAATTATTAIGNIHFITVCTMSVTTGSDHAVIVDKNLGSLVWSEMWSKIKSLDLLFLSNETFVHDSKLYKYYPVCNCSRKFSVRSHQITSDHIDHVRDLTVRDLVIWHVIGVIWCDLVWSGVVVIGTAQLWTDI